MDEIYEAKLVDFIKPSERLSGFTSKRQIARMIYGSAIVILIAIWAITGITNHLLDQAIKSTQLYNVKTYHNINGFQPVK